MHSRIVIATALPCALLAVVLSLAANGSWLRHTRGRSAMVPVSEVAGAGELKDRAKAFPRELDRGDYVAAYAMTSRAYRQRIPLRDVRAAWQQMIPPDWGSIEPIQTNGELLVDWPTKQPDDVGWVYVSLFGQVSSEGLHLLFCRENGALKICDVEFGRP